MRRKDRAMDEDFARMVLDRCEYAVLATVNGDGTPYCIPVTIVRNGNVIYFHCAPDGHKVENMRRFGSVCLTAVGDTRIPPDQFTTEYESAVAEGNAEEVLDESEKTEALRLLCRRHVPTNMGAFEEAVKSSLSRTAIWKIHIQRLTGKRKKYDKNGQEMKYGRME